MRIAIVNDMPLTVEAVRRVLTTQSEHVIAWIARDGAEAVARCQHDLPDLILMDLVMPRMDGVEATRRIMASTPCPIVIVTASAQDYTSKVFEAMGAGALDAVNTPVLRGNAAGEGPKDLLAKVETIRRLISPMPWKRAAHPGAEGTARNSAGPEALVCLGASAGGPAALARLLAGLPASFPAAVVIVQHVDSQFAAGLATWLSSHTPMPVRLIEEGDRPESGTVLLAGRDHHLVFSSSQRLRYNQAEPDCAYRPSVNEFFKSAARHCKGVVVGVVLTGMGRDGAEGLLAMRERGFLTIAQDEASSAVFGMPKAAVERKAASEILALDKIAPRLVNVFAPRAQL